MARALGPPAVVAAGYIAFAWIEGNLVVAIVAAAPLVTGDDGPPPAQDRGRKRRAEALYGIALVAAGLGAQRAR